MSCNLIRGGDFPYAWSSFWTVQGIVTYVPDDGAVLNGCMEVPTGQNGVYQKFYVPAARVMTIDVAVKVDQGQTANGNVVIVDQGENIVFNQSVGGAGDATWVASQFEIGLNQGDYTLQVGRDNGGADPMRFDGLSVAHIPVTRADIAQATHEQLGDLATLFNLSPAPVGENTEGDYTNAVTAALVTGGFINRLGHPDVRCMDTADVTNVVDLTMQAMLPKLHNMASTRVEEYALGVVREKKSTLSALETRMGIKPGQGKTQRGVVHVGRMTYSGYPEGMDDERA